MRQGHWGQIESKTDSVSIKSFGNRTNKPRLLQLKEMRQTVRTVRWDVPGIFKLHECKRRRAQGCLQVDELDVPVLHTQQSNTEGVNYKQHKVTDLGIWQPCYTHPTWLSAPPPAKLQHCPRRHVEAAYVTAFYTQKRLAECCLPSESEKATRPRLESFGSKEIRAM